MTWGYIGGAAVGVGGSFLLDKFGGDDGQQQTVSNAPWGPYQPYMIGTPGAPKPSRESFYTGGGTTGTGPTDMWGDPLFGSDRGSGPEVFDEAGYNAAIKEWEETQADSGAVGRLDEMIGQRSYYPGDPVANLTPEQMQGIRSMMGAGGTMEGFNEQLGGQMGMFMDPSFMDPNKNPYQKQYVDAAIRPLTQAYTEQALPAIRGGARMTGGSDYGSTRQGVAEGIMGRGYLDAVGDVTSGMNTELYGKNINAVQRAMGMSPMYAQMMGVPGQMYGSAGSVLQGQKQAEIGGEMDRYGYNRDIPWNDNMAFMNMLQGGSGGTTTTSGGSGGDMMNMLGMGMMGAKLGGAYGDWNTSNKIGKDLDEMFSDPNMF